MIKLFLLILYIGSYIFACSHFRIIDTIGKCDIGLQILSYLFIILSFLAGGCLILKTLTFNKKEK